MAFPTTPNMAVDQYKAEIIDHYWPNLANDIEKNVYIKATSKRALPDDYAEIGAFLTDKDRVYEALIPLEREIRQTLMSMSDVYRSNFPRTVGEALKYTHKDAPSSTAAGFKSHKLLSNALRRLEAEGGFNHERIVKGTFFADALENKTGTLHAGGGFVEPGDATGRLKSPEKRDDKATPVPLPRGIPTVAGTLDPTAFNSVLLRHGYQFKDVAAGPYHGEYTHRLQWHAIMRAKGNNTLTLKNSPLEIFKSFGYMVAKAPGNTDDPNPKLPRGNRALYIDERGNFRHLYLWEALFDTAEGETRARALRTLAYTESGLVFTCPESFNKSLMKLDQYSDNENDLWCLRVLVATRWKKRYDFSLGNRPGPGQLEKVSNRLGQNRARAVISSVARKDVTFEPALAEKKPYKPPPVVKSTLTLQEQLAAKKAAVQAAGQRPRDVVPETKKEEDKTFTHFHEAGYALAWYLQNDQVH